MDSVASARLAGDPSLVSTNQLIARSYRLERALVEALLVDFGISASQYGLLHRVGQYPDMVGLDIARLMWVTPQAVQALLSQLEGRGLIRRTGSGGRALKARLTADGEKLLESCAPVIAKYQSQTLASLDAGEREQLQSLLARYVQTAEKVLQDKESDRGRGYGPDPSA